MTGRPGIRQSKIVKREDIPEQFRWRLEDIYENDRDWEEDASKVSHMLPKIGGYRGRLGESPEFLLECLRLRDKISIIDDRLYVYSHMRRDEDNNNPVYQALADRAEGISTRVYKEFSFIVPEVLTIPVDRIKEFMKAEGGLRLYEHYIEEIMRMKEHILSEDEEKIISMAGEVTQTAENAHRMLVNADLKFPTVKDDNGQEVQLSEARYYQLIRSENRGVRKDAFQNLHNTYKEFRNTFSATLNGAVKKDIFYSRVRNYSSARESSLDADNIPLKVYDNIIDTINRNLKSLHRYVDIRRRMLGIEKVHMYDLYAPLVKGVNINLPYEEGLKLVREALQPLGRDYVRILVKGFCSRWIDVYENQGKTNGAYSWGAYDTHPYVLLNYKSTLSDVSTIAHEMGHSIHSYLTRKEQPYVYSNYTLFSAEVASTTNEALLFQYLLKTTEDKKSRIYILNQHLEGIRTTVYRQTMFAEFEKNIHEWAEDGKALTSHYLSKLWHELNVKYYGQDAVVDEEIGMEWARISHFYRNFYVYKYVTGYSAAMSLSKKIIDEGQGAVDRYIKFLKSGDSDYSINLLKEAGVDMTVPEPLENTIRVFEGLLDKLEKEIE